MRFNSTLCGIAVLLLASLAYGDNPVTPDILKKLYDDTLVQLKAAQNRKSQLAAENARLTARLAELQTQIAAQNTQLEQLRRQVTEFGDQQYFLRSHYAAWTQFLEANPSIRSQWDVYLNGLAPAPPAAELPFYDPNWPLSSRG